jgi:phospholipase C
VRFKALALTIVLAGCGAGLNLSAPPTVPVSGPSAAITSKIHHIVIVFQENRSTDDLFNGLPGADTVRSGLNSKGKQVKLQPISLTTPYDLGHTHSAFLIESANGKYDGFDKVPSGCYSIQVCIPADVRAYGYVPHKQTEPYFTMAERYSFGDHMFQTNQGPSFPAHQYIVSGTSTITDGSSLRAAENPIIPTGGTAGGCDSPPGSLVTLIDTKGNETGGVYPCFDRISLMQLLDAKSLSWRYYQANTGPGLWNGPDAVFPIFKNRIFSTDVVAPSAQVLRDIANGQLADVTWVTPTALSSDHARATNGSGPSWVAAVVNAIGKSRYWNDTAIFVTWDDWGGWYDHVKPPLYNSYELGFRVPLIVISPYAKNHYVSHVQHEFGSILKFTEEIFGLPSLHTTDERSDDLFDCFDFSKSPGKFKPIRAPYPPKYFLNQPGSELPVDDDLAYASLYSFGEKAKANDGLAPFAHVIAIAGVLYGTTEGGGFSGPGCGGGCGTIYRISTSGDERVLYRFKGGADGASPVAGLTKMGGTLFGTTEAGGSGTACAGGCGTIFKTDLNGKNKETLYSFNGGKDGANPVAGLVVIGSDLYGTTQNGGLNTHACPSGCGTVFKVTIAGKAEKVLHAFKGGSDGSQPAAGLVKVNGTLDGTTQYGGKRTPFCATGCGTVFNIDPATGAEQIAYRFDYSGKVSDGAYPAARVLDVAGSLYGTTLGGGVSGEGSVFKIAASGAESVLHSFTCCNPADGKYPLDGLVESGGILYGTTRDGGTSAFGTIFSITTSGSESVLYNFQPKPDGTYPAASLVALNGVLYGTTVSGGVAGAGTLFELTP